jgi:hypothetical protein
MLIIEEQENTAKFWNEVDPNLILVKSEVANVYVEEWTKVKRELDEVKGRVDNLKNFAEDLLAGLRLWLFSKISSKKT